MVCNVYVLNMRLSNELNCWTVCRRKNETIKSTNLRSEKSVCCATHTHTYMSRSVYSSMKIMWLLQNVCENKTWFNWFRSDWFQRRELSRESRNVCAFMFICFHAYQMISTNRLCIVFSSSRSLEMIESFLLLVVLLSMELKELDKYKFMRPFNIHLNCSVGSLIFFVLLNLIKRIAKCMGYKAFDKRYNCINGFSQFTYTILYNILRCCQKNSNQWAVKWKQNGEMNMV